MPRKQEEQDEAEQLGHGQIIKGLPGHDTMAVSYRMVWGGVNGAGGESVGLEWFVF